MSFVAQQTIEAMDRSPAGIGAATFSEVYNAQREADRLGGMSYSEVDNLAERLEPQIGRVVDRFDARIPLNKVGLWRYLQGWYDDPERVEQIRRMGGTFDRRALEEFENLNDWMNRAHAQDPDHFRTVEQLRDQLAKDARAAQERADMVTARAGGSDAFLAQMGAGAAAAFREPLLVTLGLVTAPIGAEAIGASLFARGIGRTAAEAAGIALIEAPTAAFSEYIVREGMRDFYRRQGFSDPEINARIAGDVGAAFLGGAILGPAFYLGGRAIKGITDTVLTRLASKDAKEVLEAVAEVEKAGIELTAQERADVAVVQEVVRRWDDVPPFVGNTFEEFVAYQQTVTRVIDSLERGVVPPDLPAQMAAPNVSKLRLALEGIERGRQPSRREIQRLLDKQEFADFKARLEEVIRLNRQARIKPETNAQTRVVQAIERATRLTEEGAGQKAVKAQQRARDLYGKLSDPEKRIFDLDEAGRPTLRPEEPLTRPEATRVAAQESLERAIERRMRRGEPPALRLGPRRRTKLLEDIARARDSLRRLGEVEPSTFPVKEREPRAAPDVESVARIAEGDYDDALVRDARQSIDDEMRKEGAAWPEGRLAEHRADIAEMDEDEEALEALNQCILARGG